MKILKRITKRIFYYYFNIDPSDNEAPKDLTFACDGRIIRSLSSNKKKVYGVYILNGLEH